MVTDESVSSICFLFRMPPVIVIFHYSSSFLFVFFLIRVSSEIFLYLFRFVTSLSNVVLLIYDYFRYLRFDRLRPLQDWGNWHYVQAFYFILFFFSFLYLPVCFLCIDMNFPVSNSSFDFPYYVESI